MATLIATGNLGQDAELKNANNGTPFLKFSIGDSKSKPDGNGGWQEIAQQWLNCTLWDGAETWADLRKGDRVTVYGEFYARKYESNGAEGTSLDVKVHGIQVLKRKDGGGGGYGQRSQAPAQGNNWPQQAPAPTQGNWGPQNGAQGYSGNGGNAPSPF